MNNQDNAKSRAIFLKELREVHKDNVERAKDLLKEQKSVRKQICQHIRQDGKTIPEIADLSGIKGQDVLWHLTAMKKYGLVEESGMCGEYYLYRMVSDG